MQVNQVSGLRTMLATRSTRIDVGRRTTHRMDNRALSLGSARRAVGRRVELEPYPEIGFIAQLLASELVSNTVRHANLADGDTFVLTIECDERTLHIELADHGRGVDPLSHLARYQRTGSRRNGIYLVDALADRWGYRRREGTTMWFEIDLVPGRRTWHGREAAPKTGASSRSR
jgi:anti-sigma regulatory factor (Ser/Thr protein kinase)